MKILVPFGALVAAALCLLLPGTVGAEPGDDLKALYAKARELEAARDFGAAFKVYDAILDRDEEYEDVFERWEACRSLEEWQESLSGAPTPMDLVRLGEVYLGHDRIEDERAAYREAIRMDPGCTEAHGHLALSNYTARGGDIVTVMRETMRYMETSPHREHLGRAMADFRVYGMLRTIPGVLREDLRAYKKAEEAGKLGDAADILIAAIRDHHPDAFQTALFAAAGGLRLKSGDKAGARRAFVEALRHTPHSYTIRAHVGLARLEAEEGRLRSALAHLRAAVAEGSAACRSIDQGRMDAFAPLFEAEDTAIRAAVEELTDAEKADEPIRARIRAACRRAGKEGKRVLLHWYGPYCPYVMAMEERFARPEVRAVVAKHYVHVRMDQGSMHRGTTLDTEYGDVMRRLGVPSFFILDPDGSIHTVQKDADLMGTPHRDFDPVKIVEWLERVAAED